MRIVFANSSEKITTFLLGNDLIFVIVMRLLKSICGNVGNFKTA